MNDEISDESKKLPYEYPQYTKDQKKQILGFVEANIIFYFKDVNRYNGADVENYYEIFNEYISRCDLADFELKTSYGTALRVMCYMGSGPYPKMYTGSKYHLQFIGKNYEGDQPPKLMESNITNINLRIS
jgi:hypothetical protein